MESLLPAAQAEVGYRLDLDALLVSCRYLDPLFPACQSSSRTVRGSLLLRAPPAHGGPWRRLTDDRNGVHAELVSMHWVLEPGRVRVLTSSLSMCSAAIEEIFAVVEAEGGPGARAGGDMDGMEPPTSQEVGRPLAPWFVDMWTSRGRVAQLVEPLGALRVVAAGTIAHKLQCPSVVGMVAACRNNCR